MTTEFIEYSSDRKEQIAHMRNRLMTIKPITDDHGTKYHQLDLIDFIVYAALRGANYRKADHTKGTVSDKLMKDVIAGIDANSWRGRYYRGRFLPAHQDESCATELKAILEAEFKKWTGA